MYPTIEQFARARDYGRWYAAKYPETDSATLLSIEYQHLVYLTNEALRKRREADQLLYRLITGKEV